MRQFAHILAIASVTVACIALSAPAAGQNTDTRTAPNAPRDQVPITPLRLSDEQRAQIRAALSKENTDVNFEDKEAKAAASFQPSVGAKLPKGVTPHPLPQALAFELPVLQEYKYVKFRDQLLIVNPMTDEIVDMFPG